MGVYQLRRDILWAALGEQPLREVAVLLVDLDRLQQGLDQPLAIVGANVLGARRVDPFGGDAGIAQHAFDPAAARVGDDQHRRALLAGAAGAAGTVLQRLGVARISTWMTSDRLGRSMPREGDVGGDADPGAAVAQRLQRLVTLILAMLAGQGDGAEAALDQAGVEMADIVARRAEQHRRVGFVEAQQVHDRILDVRGRHRHRLIADVAVAAVFPDRGDAQRVLLEALGQRDDRLWG